MPCCKTGSGDPVVVNVYSPVVVSAVNVTSVLLTLSRIPCDGSSVNRTINDSEPSLSALPVTVTANGTFAVSRTSKGVVATTCGLSATASTLIGCVNVLTLFL
mgnify:CR=1 FL=1